jgi:hypothetical protein
MAASKQYINLVNQLYAVNDRNLAFAWNKLLETFDGRSDSGEDEETALFQIACVCVNEYIALKDTQAYLLRETLVSLHYKKNAGYSGLNKDPWYNFKQSMRFYVTPYQGVLVRMSDKYERYKNISAAPELEQCNEALEDTLLDLCAYSLIAICLLREEVAACME